MFSMALDTCTYAGGTLDQCAQARAMVDDCTSQYFSQTYSDMEEMSAAADRLAACRLASKIDSCSKPRYLPREQRSLGMPNFGRAQMRGIRTSPDFAACGRFRLAALNRFSQLLQETEYFCWWRQQKVAKSVPYGLPPPFQAHRQMLRLVPTI
jgi:hypothetical protein